MSIFQIIDGDDILSVRHSYLRRHKLKKKKSAKNKLKTYWKFILLSSNKYLIKNVYFGKYLTLDSQNNVFLSYSRNTLWSRDLKSGNNYLTKNLIMGSKYGGWVLKSVNYSDKVYLAYIGYAFGGFVVLCLLILLLYRLFKYGHLNAFILLYIYLIVCIYAVAYIQI